jgi:hypothetical protein
MTEPTPLEDLAALVRELQDAYEVCRADILDQMGRFEHTRDLDPLQARDPNGRYLLLDALTALVNASTALVAARHRGNDGDTARP